MHAHQQFSIQAVKKKKKIFVKGSYTKEITTSDYIKVLQK